MSNIVKGIETAGKDVLHAVEWPFVHAAQMVAVLTEAMKDEPAVKQAIVGLVDRAEGIDVDAVAAIASNGTDLTGDLKALQDAASFFSYFRNSFLPVVEAAYKDTQSASTT
jgi:hypothetical protein